MEVFSSFLFVSIIARSFSVGRRESARIERETYARLESRRAINADDGAQAGSIDRYTTTADDEVGYTLLAKPREKEEAVGIAWVERDDYMAQEVVHCARIQLENGGLGERLRRRLHNTPTDVDMTAQGRAQGRENSPTDPLLAFDEGWRFNTRRLALARAAFQTRVVGGLDEVPVVVSGPLLPRPGMTMDYLPWIRAMVRMEYEGLGRGGHWATGLSREGREGLAS